MLPQSPQQEIGSPGSAGDTTEGKPDTTTYDAAVVAAVDAIRELAHQPAVIRSLPPIGIPPVMPAVNAGRLAHGDMGQNPRLPAILRLPPPTGTPANLARATTREIAEYALRRLRQLPVLPLIEPQRDIARNPPARIDGESVFRALGYRPEAFLLLGPSGEPQAIPQDAPAQVGEAHATPPPVEQAAVPPLTEPIAERPALIQHSPLQLAAGADLIQHGAQPVFAGPDGRFYDASGMVWRCPRCNNITSCTRNICISPTCLAPMPWIVYTAPARHQAGVDGMDLHLWVCSACRNIAPDSTVMCVNPECGTVRSWTLVEAPEGLDARGRLLGAGR
jgi:hypothetical protein